MYTLLNYTNSTTKRTENVSESINFLYSSSSSSADKISSILLICILSILCLFGVIFMIFGPMMRSEAWKRVDNYIFCQDMEHENQHDDGADTGGE